jgi:hypothetical protein
MIIIMPAETDLGKTMWIDLSRNVTLPVVIAQDAEDYRHQVIYLDRKVDRWVGRDPFRTEQRPGKGYRNEM